MEDFDKLINRLYSSINEDELINTAYALGDLGDVRAVPHLIQLLDSTESPSVRNAVAIALHDLGDKRAISALLRHIKDPKNITNRGTLVYALETLDPRSEIVDLVQLMCDGNYEVMAMVLRVIEGFSQPLTPDNKQKAISVLQKCLAQNQFEDWKKEFISSAIELLHKCETELPL
ncbi:HEAT repeat domain-containing protein [Kallotenue papyrolyticum]|uniref:HEAT repeat domain-containing protein n=1 Tax=Kallotenue papyrolyticum TaxID=1325125 RepID=UPI0009DD7237|nr:HEAT repeat domain-containing protein [Kallotenue papyrolyticum]